MHAAALAEELDIARIACPRASGVLSALGLIAAGRRRDAARTLLLRGDELTAERLAAEVAASPSRRREGLEGARDRGRLRAALPRPVLRAAGPRPARAGPGEPARGLRGRARGALRLPRPRGGLELVNVRVAAVVPGPRARPASRRRASELERSTREAASTARGSRPRCCAASPPKAPRPRARASSSCPRRRWSCARVERRASTRPGRSSPSGERRSRASVDPVTLQVAAGALRAGVRGDGRGADPLGPLAEHQGAPRLLDRPVRPRRRAGDAGRAHPGPPRLDARRGRGGPRRGAGPDGDSGSSTTPTAAAPTCPTSR